jgi:tRNA(His) 5'-end guanylyltransferase
MKDPLGDRMKEQYENRTRFALPRRTYTIIRLDGKAFHTFTKGMERPFDKALMKTMDETTKYLCANIMGCVFGYTQSDEISLLLTDFATDRTESFFDGNIQKIASVSAGMASAKFTLEFGKIAVFDSRVFTIADRVEVGNYFIWRQNDSTRNSIQMVAQSLYSHKELHGAGFSQLNELIFQKGKNFNDYHSHAKRGRAIVREITEGTFKNPKTGLETKALRSKWVVLEETPLFTKDNFLDSIIPKYRLQEKAPAI